jgi:hypothetical protein
MSAPWPYQPDFSAVTPDGAQVHFDQQSDWSGIGVDAIAFFIDMKAPAAPPTLRRLVLELVTNSRMTSDHLLLVADGYAEGALELAFGGEAQRPAATSIHALAKILRDRAPHHAKGD